jgi:alpha-1,2-mannosyltransferase
VTDVIVPGFHASTPDDFASGFAQALALKDEESYAMRCRARKSSWRFSEEVFIEAWTNELVELVGLTDEEKLKKSP